MLISITSRASGTVSALVETLEENVFTVVETLEGTVFAVVEVLETTANFPPPFPKPINDKKITKNQKKLFDIH